MSGLAHFNTPLTTAFACHIRLISLQKVKTVDHGGCKIHDDGEAIVYMMTDPELHQQESLLM